MKFDVVFVCPCHSMSVSTFDDSLCELVKRVVAPNNCEPLDLLTTVKAVELPAYTLIQLNS